MIPSNVQPILRPEFTALMNAEEAARRLRSPESVTPEHEAKPLALKLIDDAISHLVDARNRIDPTHAQEKTDG